MEHSAWHDLIKKELPEGYFAQINHFMNEVYAQGVIYPPRDKVFNAIQTTPLIRLRLLLLVRILITDPIRHRDYLFCT